MILLLKKQNVQSLTQDTWKADLIFEKESFELLQDILESAGELDSRAPYEKLVTTEFAKKAME